MSAAGAPVLVVDGLTARPGTRELRRFWRAFVAEHPQVRAPRSRTRVAVLLIAAVLSGLGALVAALGMVSLLTREQGATPGEILTAAVVALLFSCALVILGRAAVHTGRRRMWPRQHWALARFGADNGFTYRPGPFLAGLPTRSYRGRLVQTRALRWATPAGRLIEWSDFEQDWGTSAYRHTQFGGWIRIGLSHPLPRIVLPPAKGDARALITENGPAQREPLEEDNLSFAPALLAEMKGWHVEIIDDVLLMTRSRDVVTTDPAEWSETLRVTAAVVDRLEERERRRAD
ncbi:hypothetical protein [Microbacterium sp. RG1]|uniref:hypothetical protein n=1 Tax=Microbacterium sp. RG1 TaxID=2489212 RepID=UPI0010CA3A8A|nr:hypothetical protein [Microbacterium sp. RG1]QCQ15462.1 hypothetical protein EHF32_01220 [Microbacterium sp. RG1]